MIEQVIAGAVGAAFYGFTVYQKKKRKQDFDWNKFGPTVVIGAIIGGVAGWQGLEYNMVVDATWVGMATVLVQNVWKIAMRKVFNK